MANWIRYRKRKFRPRLEDIANLDLIGYQGRTQDFKLAGAGVKKKKKKKLQIGIHIVLKNYKYTKSLFLNTLRCKDLPTKTKTKTK